jgi:LysR family transcriptional activator of nhaA
MDVKGYSHPLGECGVAFYAAPELADRLTEPFPRCLHGAPFLLPGEDSALRLPLSRWLERQGLQPRIVGEFDDSALMKAFGQAGSGIFPAAAAPGLEIAAQYGVVRLGESAELRERFFAITVERHLSHPAVLAVSHAAQAGLTGKQMT